jgi:hypothetical protein
MMSTRLYVYAIIDAPIPVEDLTGLAGETLSLIDGPSCRLVIGRMTTSPEASAATLGTQDALVRTLATRTEALLPMRFGTAFDSEPSLLASLAKFEGDRIRTALARVRGCEQMILRVFRAEPLARQPEPKPKPEERADVATMKTMGPGTTYLTQRAAAMQMTPATLLAPLLRGELATIARDEIAEAAEHAPLIGSVFHLIRRGDAERYRAIVSAWPPPSGITLRVSGPSPAYAFAKDALS